MKFLYIMILRFARIDQSAAELKLGALRRNIREVMDETKLEEATLAAQRQEMERLRRVQEQQKMIRDVCTLVKII